MEVLDALKDGERQLGGVQTEVLLARQELPAPRNHFLLEIVAQRPVAQHFKEGQVAWVAHVVNITRADALLHVGQARAGGVGRTHQVRHERVHTGGGEQDGRVIFRNNGGGGNPMMSLGLHELLEHFPQLGGCNLLHKGCSLQFRTKWGQSQGLLYHSVMRFARASRGFLRHLRLLRTNDLRHHPNGEGKRQHIRQRLADFQPAQPPHVRQHQQRRNQEQALPRRRQNRRADAVANRLRVHVAQRNKAPRPHGQNLNAEGFRADADDLRVGAAEQRDDRLGKDEARHTQHQQHNRRYLDAEGKRTVHPVIFPCAVIEAADRLEALPEADDGGIDEIQASADNRERRNRRVAIDRRGIVEQRRRHAHDALPPQRRQTVVQDFAVHLPRWAVVARMNRDGVGVRAAHHQQDDKARQLRNCRRNRCARNAHVEHENQQRVKEHIQHAAGNDADHAIRRQALEAQEVVH